MASESERDREAGSEVIDRGRSAATWRPLSEAGGDTSLTANIVTAGEIEREGRRRSSESEASLSRLYMSGRSVDFSKGGCIRTW